MLLDEPVQGGGRDLGGSGAPTNRSFVCQRLAIQATLRGMIGSTSGFVKIAGNLKVHPELRCCFQDTGKQNSGFGSHIPFAVDECVHTLDRNPHFAGELDLAHPERLKEVLQQNSPRMCWLSILRCHVLYPLQTELP